MQPIVGALLGVARPGNAIIDWLPLYAQDEEGYANLCSLVSEAHLGRPVEEEAHVALDALEGRTAGLIALTGGGEGALARLIAEEQPFEAMLDRLQALFPGPALHRAEPARRSGRAGGGSGADRPGLRAQSAARRDQSRRLSRRRFPSRARRDALHRPVEPDRARRPHPILTRGLDEARRRHASVVRRSARSDRQHVGDRPPLRLRSAVAKADPSAHRRRCRCRGRAAPPRCPRRTCATAFASMTI